MARLASVRWQLGILALLFVGSMLIFWPGIVSPDGANQYAAARAGVYTDHHPPAMSFAWRYLDRIYPGPGLILTLHLSMLYAAAAIFVISFRTSLFKWWYAFFPLIPNILSYSALIVKDVGFTYSYLLAGAILAYMMLNKVKQGKFLLLTLVIVLLFYGTAVKYQARFLLIFLTLGVGFCLQYKYSWRAVVGGFVLYLVLLQAMLSFNAWLVPEQQESHSWQLVKLYDLTGISLALNKPLYPEFVKQNPNYNFAKVKAVFSQSEVDPLVFPVNSPLKSGVNEQQRTELARYWLRTVTDHPIYYLQHRLRLWSFNMFSTPSGRSHPADYFRSTFFGPLFSQPLIYETIGIVYGLMKNILQFIWLLPLLLFYTYLSFAKRNKSSAAAPLMMFCAVSVTMLIVLFFFSMAATARYVFICTCLVHASHGFAYKCWRS
jgi:hypothetical protein